MLDYKLHAKLKQKKRYDWIIGKSKWLTIHVRNQFASWSSNATKWSGSIRPALDSESIEPKENRRTVSLIICSTWLNNEKFIFQIENFSFKTFRNISSNILLFLEEIPVSNESKSIKFEIYYFDYLYLFKFHFNNWILYIKWNSCWL
jgi:hypothetical protein